MLKSSLIIYFGSKHREDNEIYRELDMINRGRKGLVNVDTIEEMKRSTSRADAGIRS